MRKAIWLLAALIAGVALGGVLHQWRSEPWVSALVDWIGVIGQVFLRLIFMIVVPLVVSALLLGAYELGRGSGMARVFGKTLGCTVLASSAAVLIGVTLVNIFQPGVGAGLKAAEPADSEKIRAAAAAAKPAHQALVELIPRNVLDSAVRALDGEIIALMVACLILGVAMAGAARADARIEAKISGTLVPLLESVLAICLRVVGYAMLLAPAGVFALVLTAAFRNGLGVFATLIGFVGVVVGALLIQQCVVYPLMLRFLAGRPAWKFLRDCREVMVYAFSTSSSNATLPKSLETAETTLRIPPRVARFVLTAGATGNQNGTALFEGVTVLFLAQVYGIELTLAQQVQVVLMSILAGIGTAGVPGGSLPLIVIVMQSVGVPAEGIGLILGVDRFLDMCRTVVNVTGDLVVAAVVGRGEGESDDALL